MLRKFLEAAWLAAIAVMFVAGNSQAQTQVSATETAGARVYGALTITRVDTVFFGAIQNNVAGTVYLDPQGSANTSVGLNAQVGRVDISSDAGASIRIGWTPQITLSDGAATPNLITYTLKVNGDDSGDAGDQSGNNILTLSGSGYVSVTPTHSSYTLWIGGSLSSLTGKPAGHYSSLNTSGQTATFTVEYN